jgi:2-(1,2-epoxy-1,2-dihydrophenyl)acetyl-CoA isomerase
VTDPPEPPAGVDLVVDGGGVAHLRLVRPEAANTIDLPTARALQEAVERLADDPAVRAVLITGAGRMFCGGGDLRAFSAEADLPRHLRAVTDALHMAVVRLGRLDAPVVAAVQGSAAGAGFSLACAADLVLAAESARFVPAYTRIGLSPDGSLTATLPRLVGARRAAELLLTNRSLDAREAVDWGIATRVVPDGSLLEEAQGLAAELARGPVGSYGAVKRLLRSTWTLPLEAQLVEEAQTLSARASTAEGREGIAAFLAKRAPDYVGLDGAAAVW